MDKHHILRYASINDLNVSLNALELHKVAESYITKLDSKDNRSFVSDSPTGNISIATDKMKW